MILPFEILILGIISITIVSIVFAVCWLILKKFIPKKFKNKIFKLFLVFCIVLYLLIGFYVFNQDLINPKQFTTEYLEWRKSTPIEDRVIDTLLWPGILIGNKFFP